MEGGKVLWFVRGTRQERGAARLLAEATEIVNDGLADLAGVPANTLDAADLANIAVMLQRIAELVGQARSSVGDHAVAAPFSAIVAACNEGAAVCRFPMKHPDGTLQIEPLCSAIVQATNLLLDRSAA